MFRHICLVLLILLGCAVLSCEKGKAPSSIEDIGNQNILRYDVSYRFSSLNPQLAESSGSTYIFPLLYSYLFVPNINGKLEPDLAIQWSYDPKQFTWTIHTQKNARFHNGQPVTSTDVKYSFESVLQKNRPSLFSLINRISILPITAFTIQLKKNDPQFLQKIWDMEIIPFPGESPIDYYYHPIGSGPFKFKSRNGENEIVLEANEDYIHGWPSLDGVVFHFEPDKEKSWARLLAGKTDIAQEISPKNYEMIRQYEKRFYFNLQLLQYYTILLYNTKDPLFSDTRVRQALTYAIDREYIVNDILKGFGRIAAGPMGTDSPYHNPDVKPIPYYPRKTISLLKESGWSYDQAGRYLIRHDQPFDFSLFVFEESQIEKKVARYLQLCLNDLGVQVRLELVSYKELQRRYHQNDEFHAVLTELIGAYRGPENILQLWARNSEARSEAGCFDDTDVTRLINGAIDEKNPEKQQALFYEVDAQIQSLQPGTFLYHKTAIDVMSKRFTLPFPFSLTHAGIYRLRHATLNKGE